MQLLLNLASRKEGNEAEASAAMAKAQIKAGRAKKGDLL